MVCVSGRPNRVVMDAPARADEKCNRQELQST